MREFEFIRGWVVNVLRTYRSSAFKSLPRGMDQRKARAASRMFSITSDLSAVFGVWLHRDVGSRLPYYIATALFVSACALAWRAAFIQT